MKLIQLVLKAKGLGFNYIAIDSDKAVYGFTLLPIIDTKVDGNHYWYASRQSDSECSMIGYHNYPVTDVTKLIININKLTLRNVL